MQQALSGSRVVDFGTALAGPLVGALLADMGAEVIKIESKTRLDGFRMGRPIIGQDTAGGDEGKWPDLMPGFHAVNRNKLSVTVDMKTPDGVRLVKALIKKSDVVTNNYAPGVLGRLGLDYPSLAKENPRLVMASMPAAGLTGPLRDMVSYASVVAAASGLMSMIGYEDGEMVGQVQGPWGDVVASLTVTMGIVAALRHRHVTGRGQFIEIAQIEAQTTMLGEALMDYQMNKRVRGPQGNYDPNMAPHNVYRCAGDDRWVAVEVATEEQWKALCKVIGDPDWAKDPRFQTLRSRGENRKELDQRISDWTSSRSPEEVTELLQAVGVAAMTVMNVEDHFTNPHFQHRGFGVEVEQPMVGVEWLPGFPWRMSKTPGQVQRHAPLLGEHNEYVWCSIVGLSKEEYERLVQAEVVK
ncbi:MAG: CoA transferase [Chloroflexi bacterium]|nr:CoA transferase [Chloroflexota bacterium]